jgi:uroporphyrinogen decarboxylase
MEKLTAMTIGYLKQQIQHGAQAIQLFDSWAGLLSLAEYQRWVLPWNQKIINALKDHAVPKIFFAYGATHLLPLLSQIKANVIGLDWRTCLVDARKYLGDHYTLQGNLDPAILLTNPQVVHAKALELANLKLGSHIINLGHGILPETPIENVQALVDGVRYAANNQS